MATTKFTVIYGKRAARLELPPTATLAALAEELAARFAVAQPLAIKLKLPEAESSLRVRDYPAATLESAGIGHGCKVVDVDYSVLPFSYGIEIEGHCRETEATCLAPLPQEEPAAA
ncbi:hypothetical protein ABPG75_001874 [Micractinium tetrahymenae]